MAHATTEKVPKKLKVKVNVKKVHIHNESGEECDVKEGTTEYPLQQTGPVAHGQTREFHIKPIPPLVAGRTYDYQVRPNDIRSITVPCTDKHEYVR